MPTSNVYWRSMMTKGESVRVVYIIGYITGVSTLAISVAVDSLFTSAFLGNAIIMFTSIGAVFVGSELIERLFGDE